MRHPHVVASGLLVLAWGCVDLTLPPLSAPAPDGDASDAVDLVARSDGAPADAPIDVPLDQPDAGPDRPPDGGAETAPADASDARDASDTSERPPSTLGQGLVAYFRLDDNGGVTAADSSGRNNDGIIEGRPGLQQSNLPPLAFSNAGAFVFQGNEDAVWVPDSASLRPASTTVAAWVRFASLTARGKCGSASDQVQYIVFRHNPSIGNGLIEGLVLMKQADGKLAFLLEDGNGVRHTAVSTTSASTGSWMHVVGTFDSATQVMRIYVDGDLEATLLHDRAISYDTAASSRLWIGRTGECRDQGLGVQNFDAKLNGVVDDVRIYDRALTSREVSSLASGEN